MSITLMCESLTAESFAPYGDVIQKQGNRPLDMNSGMAKNYRALGLVNTQANKGESVISIVESQQYKLHSKLTVVERHPLGSQAFIPQSNTPFIVIVAVAGEWQGSDLLKAFKTDGLQGVNYHVGTWHSPLFTPFGKMDFICIDRQGNGNNCDVIKLDKEQQCSIAC